MYLATGHYLWGAMADEKYTVEVVGRVDDAEIKKATASANDMAAALKTAMAAMAELTRESKSGGPSALSKWGLSPEQAKTMKDTTSAMKSASDAVAAFGRASKSMDGMGNIGDAARVNAKAMVEWRNSLSGIKGLSERELSKLNEIASAMRTSSDAVNTLTKAYQDQLVAKRALYEIEEKSDRAKQKLALDEAKQAETVRANKAKEHIAQQKADNAVTLGLINAETTARRVATAEKNADTKASAVADKANQEGIRNTTALEIDQSRTARAESRNATQLALEEGRQIRQSRAIAHKQDLAERRSAVQSLQAQAQAREQAINQEIRAMESARFAARELATMYTVAGAALMAGPIAAIKAYSTQERAFADVQRTAQEASMIQLDELSNKYMKLSTEIPIAYQELSRIGTLGAQMDIPMKDLDDFTEAVGTFAAITGESADSSAMAFGRISNMLGGLQ